MHRRLSGVLFVLPLLAACAQRPAPPDCERLPHTLGLWSGSDHAVDAESRNLVGADVLVCRSWRGVSGRSVASALTVYTDWKRGFYHNPVLAYRATGWTLRSKTDEALDAGRDRKARVSLSRWERKGERILLLYWYQAGMCIVLDRSEEPALPTELRNKEKRPRLVRVQFQVLDDGTAAAEEDIKDLATEMAKWLADPRYDP